MGRPNPPRPPPRAPARTRCSCSVYALFTLAAGARSLVQLATKADEAPFAYVLSLLAAVTYALGWLAIRQASEGRTAFASRMLWIELAGVLAVGTAEPARGRLVPRRHGVVGLRHRLRLRARWSSPSPACSGCAPRIRRARAGAPSTAFRVVAVAEALSWLGLLTGMFFKYVVDAGEQGVQVFGPIHGTVFLTYLVVTLLTWRSQRWSLPIGLLALVASVPPFCTVVFEVWARRTGRLDPGT